MVDLSRTFSHLHTASLELSQSDQWVFVMSLTQTKLLSLVDGPSGKSLGCFKLLPFQSDGIP